VDPNWRDLLLFYESFHGDNGAGIGASHQTGWSALVAPLILLLADLDAQEARTDLGAIFRKLARRLDQNDGLANTGTANWT
jgi:poly(3-hydroxybutyrate) depolymerase